MAVKKKTTETNQESVIQDVVQTPEVNNEEPKTYIRCLMNTNLYKTSDVISMIGKKDDVFEVNYVTSKYIVLKNELMVRREEYGLCYEVYNG